MTTTRPVSDVASPLIAVARPAAPTATSAESAVDEGGVIQSFGILAILVIATGAAGYLISGSAVPWVLISAISPYLLAVSIPATVLLAATRHWGLLPFTVAGLAMWLFVQVPAFVADAAPSVSGASLNVMTTNIGLGGADPRALVAEVRSRHVDALMVQELTPYGQLQLAEAGLDSVLPHKITEPGDEAKGTGLWSRYPLTEVEWPRLFFSSIAARVSVPGMTERPTLAAVHVPGPTPDSLYWRSDLSRLRGMLASLPGDGPVVVGGDFNAGRSVPRFRELLDEGYADASEQAGAGLLPTYPSDQWFPPVLELDHVLTRDAVGRSADTVTIPGTDHRALVVRVALGAVSDTR